VSELGLDTESMASGDPGGGAALDLGEQTLESKNYPKVANENDWRALPHGATYLDPEGKQRFKPIRNKDDYLGLPEGAEYADPEGNVRTKPKYEGIDFTPQALFDMAHSDKGRKKALEKYYPGKVRDDPQGGFFIEDDGGKLRKPGRGASSVGGFLASETAPSILAGLGSMAGGAAGTAVAPGVGTAAGGAGGAALGGYVGSKFNDTISQLAGVYDDEGADTAAMTSAAFSAVGDVGGRALSAIPAVAKGTGQLAARGAAKTANKFLGTDQEALETAVPIAEAGEQPGKGPLGLSKAGTEVSPSAIFKSSPHLTNVAEILAQKFDSSDTYLMHAERFMDQRAKDILAHKDIGAIVESIVHPKAAVPTEETGWLLKRSAEAKAVQQSAEHDRALADALANRKAAVEDKYKPDIEKYRQRNESVVVTAEQAKKSADELVQQGFKDIEKQADDAFKVAKVGHNSGDLWRTVAESFVKLRRSIGMRAEKMYGDAETASGGLVPQGSNGLSRPAEQLLSELPEGFESLHPSIVKKLRDMAGVKDPKTGEWVKEPADASWVQLHNLRTQIRQDIKWNDLTSDVRNGTLKFLDGKINEVLHPIEDSAAPEIKEASRLLKLADGFYRENMGPLNDRQLRTLVKALETGGVQADPKALLKVAIRDGKTETANVIKKTVGPQVWDAMRAADVKEMLAQSQQIGTKAYDGVAFAKQILDRKKNGVLDVLHGDAGAARLEQQAAYVEKLRGKLEIEPRPGDTANDIILRARAAAADAEAKAASDPLKAMQNEMRKVEAATKKEFAAQQAERTAADPLAFLNNATVGAHAAVDKILGNPDLIVAAARSFAGGEQSPEFKLLRQAWTERFMRETLEPGEKLAKVSPEIQELMFPGVTLDDMHMLAKEMKLLMSGHTMRGEDTAGGMMAQAAVEHPFGQITGLGKLAGPIKIAPGANFAARAGLTAFYNTIRGVLTSPSTLRWLRKGLQSRDPAEREAAREGLKAALQRGGAMGAAMGQGVGDWMEEPGAGTSQ
jgi:hypothetical protein